jgi:hypothetical protein
MRSRAAVPDPAPTRAPVDSVQLRGGARTELPERDLEPSVLADSDLQAGCPYKAPYSERVDLIIDGHLQTRPAGPLGRRRGVQQAGGLRPGAV